MRYLNETFYTYLSRTMLAVFLSAIVGLPTAFADTEGLIGTWSGAIIVFPKEFHRRLLR
jgi:hypothetical protein